MWQLLLIVTHPEISYACLTHSKHLPHSKRHRHLRYMVIHPCNGVRSAWTSGSWCEWTPGGLCRWVSRSRLRARRRAAVAVAGRCARGCRWKRKGSGRWGHPAWAGTGARWWGASAIATPHWTPTRRALRTTSTWGFWVYKRQSRQGGIRKWNISIQSFSCTYSFTFMHLADVFIPKQLTFVNYWSSSLDKLRVTCLAQGHNQRF